jgi:hypothetical protein
MFWNAKTKITYYRPYINFNSVFKYYRLRLQIIKSRGLKSAKIIHPTNYNPQKALGLYPTYKNT